MVALAGVYAVFTLAALVAWWVAAEHAPPGGAGRAGTGAGSTRRVTVAHLPLVSFPVLRLDHVLVRDLTPVEARVGAARASDHRPIHTRLRLPAAPPTRAS